MTRTLATFFLVAAIVALLAPVASAESSPRPVRPDDRGGLLGIGAVEATKAGAQAPRPDGRVLPDAADVPPVVVSGINCSGFGSRSGTERWRVDGAGGPTSSRVFAAFSAVALLASFGFATGALFAGAPTRPVSAGCSGSARTRM